MKAFFANVADSIRDTLKLPQSPSAELPIFPLGSVLFPGGTMALKIFELRYLDMAKSSLKTGAPFGIALIREGAEVGIPAIPETVGTLAYVTDWDMRHLGILQVRVTGAGRFKILSRSTSKDGLITGQVSILPEDAHSDCPEQAACAEFLRKIFARVGLDGNAKEQRFDDAGWVGFRLAELLPFNNAIKQKLLALTDARMRLEILYRFLSDQRLIR